VVALVLLVLLGAAAPQLVNADRRSPSPAVPAGAPGPLVAVARQAGQLTGVDATVLLAISQVECDFGRCRAGQSDALVPADVRSHVDGSALRPDGETARLLGIADGRRIGDWVNPLAVAGGQHAMGFMQFLPSTWRQEARLAPGRPTDPYRPYDAMVAAGSYLARLQAGRVDGRKRSLRGALAVYGGATEYADRVLAVAGA
jgi:membrane-bound lytic murein transglycosylase B